MHLGIGRMRLRIGARWSLGRAWLAMDPAASEREGQVLRSDVELGVQVAPTAAVDLELSQVMVH